MWAEFPPAWRARIGSACPPEEIGVGGCGNSRCRGGRSTVDKKRQRVAAIAGWRRIAQAGGSLPGETRA